MSRKITRVPRRRFLKTAIQAGGLLMAPQLIPGAALGKDGAVAPSQRIVMGGIGIGRRGTYDMTCFLPQPDVQFVAVADIKAGRRAVVKQMIDKQNGNQDCDTYRDLRDLLARDDIDAVLIATGPNWHATAAILAARAGKDMYCEKPCTKNIVQSLALAETMRRTGRIFQVGTQRRSLPHFAFACKLANTGKLGKLRAVHAKPAGMKTVSSGWLPAEPEPPKEEVDWDLYLGPSAWRPFNKKLLDGFNFEKGGGMVGGGVLEWGSHCVDLCQLAADADNTAPVEYNPPGDDGHVVARYADGVKLIIREDGWLPLGSCPVRFEGDDGWVEAGDSGKL
ncbi:MAG: Gfo/Idh/MocA family oxidoreductase, partial [Planctomycetes bacterium]|nr:Gfo/Idh/MocA family oxidoreductase [Planctomycetota bacterium]